MENWQFGNIIMASNQLYYTLPLMRPPGEGRYQSIIRCNRAGRREIRSKTDEQTTMNGRAIDDDRYRYQSIANHRSAICKSESIGDTSEWHVSNLSRLNERGRRSVLDTFSGEIPVSGQRLAGQEHGTVSGSSRISLTARCFPLPGYPFNGMWVREREPTFDRYVAPPPLSSLEK